METNTFLSHGKLLLTGEYVVLDGALSLAIPTKFGQILSISPATNQQKLYWKSLDERDKVWFEDEFYFENGTFISKNNTEISTRLIQILAKAKKLNPRFSPVGLNAETKLNFNRDWGLGTSSTLIHSIATWADVDPYKLLEHTFGGSGYDIACASSDSPLTYQLDVKTKIVNPVDFNPSFKDDLYFVHLNKKQNSREGISKYKNLNTQVKSSVEVISSITKQIIQSNTLNEFETLIHQHEQIISNLIKQKPVKDLLFNDYTFGQIKSLGAWGGDFVLATSKTDPSAYFKSKGYDTIIPYNDMILK
ncbi:mevalonate kinase [Flavobacteriaceae bacterium MAR_2010_72]|nr:mevalonate kinase [Flavobacteriaceae bacterium MAR_2010_72]TVZ57835.1 mevalonate kinase [Flavobacteriaceae bacterium MAR_2010_105]